jgi:hypothetical protein
MNWTSLAGKRLYPYIEAIRQACLERATAAGNSAYVTAFGTAVTAGMITDYPTLPQVIDDFIDVCLAGSTYAYVNHTDSSGNWDGDLIPYDDIGNPFPYWTEADMLTAISAGSRILSADTGLPLAAWAMQVQAILNLLLWTIQRGESWALTRDGRQGIGTTYALAVAAFNAASWTGAGSGGSTFAAQEVHDNRTIYTCTRFRSSMVLNGWATAMKHTMDGYVQFERVSGATYSDPDYSTVDPGTGPMGQTQWRLKRIKQWTTPFDDASQTEAVGDIATITISDPGSGNRAAWNVSKELPDHTESSASPWTLINKWNVTDGFAYT